MSGSVNELRDMTPDEVTLATAAASLDMPPGRGARIWRMLISEAGRHNPMITDRQAAWLWGYIRERRDKLSPMCQTLVTHRPEAARTVDPGERRIEIVGPVMDIARSVAGGAYSVASVEKRFARTMTQYVADVDAGRIRTMSVKQLRWAMSICFTFRRSMTIAALRWLPALRVDVGSAEDPIDVRAILKAKRPELLSASLSQHWLATGQLVYTIDGQPPLRWEPSPLDALLAEPA